MGRKVFVSYKYKDNDVKELPNVTQPTIVAQLSRQKSKIFIMN